MLFLDASIFACILICDQYLMMIHSIMQSGSLVPRHAALQAPALHGVAMSVWTLVCLGAENVSLSSESSSKSESKV